MTNQWRLRNNYFSGCLCRSWPCKGKANATTGNFEGGTTGTVEFYVRADTIPVKLDIAVQGESTVYTQFLAANQFKVK